MDYITKLTYLSLKLLVIYDNFSSSTQWTGGRRENMEALIMAIVALLGQSRGERDLNKILVGAIVNYLEARCYRTLEDLKRANETLITSHKEMREAEGRATAAERADEKMRRLSKRVDKAYSQMFEAMKACAAVGNPDEGPERDKLRSTTTVHFRISRKLGDLEKEMEAAPELLKQATKKWEDAKKRKGDTEARLERAQTALRHGQAVRDFLESPE